MFFYDSYLILDHYQVSFIEIFQEHLQFPRPHNCSSFCFQFSLHAHYLFAIYHKQLVGPNFNLIFGSFRQDIDEKEKKRITKKCWVQKIRKICEV